MRRENKGGFLGLGHGRQGMTGGFLRIMLMSRMRGWKWAGSRLYGVGEEEGEGKAEGKAEGREICAQKIIQRWRDGWANGWMGGVRGPERVNRILVLMMMGETKVKSV